MGVPAETIFGRGIHADVPKGIVGATKFGEFFAGAYQPHESGIVYHLKRPCFVGMATEGGTPESLSHVIQEISSTIFREIQCHQT